MATFVPAISNIIGRNDSKHMVATTSVLFHPARSQGSMFEATFLALVAFVYSALISFASMGVSILFGQVFHLIGVGHLLVLIIFCGGGLGLVGWIKYKLGNPLVNVACSLASLAVITILTQEGAVQAAQFSTKKVTQVLKMVIMGILISNAVCFLVIPVSARKVFRQNVIDVTDSFGEIFSIITHSFLSGSEEELEDSTFIDLENCHQKLILSLARSLRESKYEHYAWGTEVEHHLEAKLVDCMQRMAQNVGGLRSAAATQFSLLAQETAPGHESHTTFKRTLNQSSEDSVQSPRDLDGRLASIDELSEDGAVAESPKNLTKDPVDTAEDMSVIRSPVEMFEKFIEQLGPSIVRLFLILRC